MTLASHKGATRTEKRCSTCGLVKPLREFDLRSQRRRRYAPRSRCRVCDSPEARAARAESELARAVLELLP